MKDPREQNKNGPGLSRRQFLKGTGAAAATSALATVPLQALAAPDKDDAGKTVGMGPAPLDVQLTVNGRQIKQKVEPRVTLLDALRNYMDVTGCKRVCDRGTCGACTVMLDGKPIYACTMLAVEAQGHEIQTAESLVQGEKLDAVPAAFVRFDAQQCGFCTPGFVVALKAVLQANPKASPQEVEKGLAGNIC